MQNDLYLDFLKGLCHTETRISETLGDAFDEGPRDLREMIHNPSYLDTLKQELKIFKEKRTLAQWGGLNRKQFELRFAFCFPSEKMPKIKLIGSDVRSYAKKNAECEYLLFPVYIMNKDQEELDRFKIAFWNSITTTNQDKKKKLLEEYRRLTNNPLRCLLRKCFEHGSNEPVELSCWIHEDTFNNLLLLRKKDGSVSLLFAPGDMASNAQVEDIAKNWSQ